MGWFCNEPPLDGILAYFCQWSVAGGVFTVIDKFTVLCTV